MTEEVVELFRPIADGVIVDATFGGGGHSARLTSELGSQVRVVGLDRDPDTGDGVAVPGTQVVRANFRALSEVLDEMEVEQITGALVDLGVSSHQLDTPERGFSYHQAGPLDMRMGPDATITADHIVNTYRAEELERIIRRWGEERYATRIAGAIVAARPVTDTAHLARVVAEAVPAPARRGGHPARRTFQAIRIAVNDELEALREGLEAALGRLAPGGRCVVIAYHSLEDRLVKRRFAAGARGCVCPPDLPVCGCGRSAELRLLTRKPLRPSPAELERNPRARSARLRAAEKVAA